MISRRMIRDERLRETRATSGKLGGNPALLKQKTTLQVNQTPNQKPTPAFASALNTNPSERAVDKSDRTAVGDRSPQDQKPNGALPKLPPQWWTDDNQTDQVGRILGVLGQRGEFYPAYRTRLFAEIRRRKGETGKT